MLDVVLPERVDQCDDGLAGDVPEQSLHLRTLHRLAAVVVAVAQVDRVQHARLAQDVPAVTGQIHFKFHKQF